MSRRSVNLLDCELDESLDRAGFRHRAASIGQRIGASHLGASVYEAELINGGDGIVRALCLSTTGLPVIVCYPDNRRWLVQNGPGSEARMLWGADPLGGDEGDA